MASRTTPNNRDTTPNNSAAPPYDLLLFGVTGFTGKLVVKYLLTEYGETPSFTWALCARSRARAESALAEVARSLSADHRNSLDQQPPELEIADLVLPDALTNPDEYAAQEARLREVVRKSKVVISTCGPYAVCGKDLVRLCAEEGVHYADITGESNFVREMIELHDDTARKSGAKIIPHCGLDCVPYDMTFVGLCDKVQQEHGPVAKISGLRTYLRPRPPTENINGPRRLYKKPDVKIFFPC